MLFYVLKYKNIYFYVGVYSMTNQLDKIHLLLETMKQYAAVPITKQADLIKQLTFMMGAIYTNTNNKADRLSYYANISYICQTNHLLINGYLTIKKLLLLLIKNSIKKRTWGRHPRFFSKFYIIIF